MKRAGRYWPKSCFLASSFAVVLALCLTSRIGVAQSTAAAGPGAQAANDLAKYPGLLAEFAHLIDRFQHELRFPPPRSESRLLPLLPHSTVFYAAFSNYGDVSQQALQIFHDELQQSPVLRDWYDAQSSGADKAEQLLGAFYQLSQYLGDEIVVSGASQNGEPNGLLVAEIRKPGLKPFLQGMIAGFPGKSRPPVHVLDPKDLANVNDLPKNEAVILVRSDFVIAASDLATVRNFNAQLAKVSISSLNFAATGFGQRLMQAYEGGVTTVGGVDLHDMQTLLKQTPASARPTEAALQQTGFSDVKYLVWEHKTIDGRATSQAELSFNGPRRGIAAWLAAPRHLESFDFMSPHPMFAVALGLTSPAQMYDDIRQLSTNSNPNAFAMIDFLQQAAAVKLKEDVLSKLTGEIAIEVESAVPPTPVWRVILGVNDPTSLGQSLSAILVTSHLQQERIEDAGVTYYAVTVPSPAKPVKLAYAFVDGYLVIGSSHESVANAVRRHQSGDSLLKSTNFQASLPPGHPSGISAVFYEDPAAFMALGLAQASPEVKQSISHMLSGKNPVVVCAYGEENAIRESTTSMAFDPAAIMIGSAIAIPNLLRARTSANEASAVATLNTINTAEFAYSVKYPGRRFAPELATLGRTPGAAASTVANAAHANLIDSALGNPSCTANVWCVKDGFRFRLIGTCTQNHCRDYVAIGTPLAARSGGKNFCSTSDGVIRQSPGVPLSTAISATECRTWAPLR